MWVLGISGCQMSSEFLGYIYFRYYIDIIKSIVLGDIFRFEDTKSGKRIGNDIRLSRNVIYFQTELGKVL
jgi:hypothetical protein